MRRFVACVVLTAGLAVPLAGEANAGEHQLGQPTEHQSHESFPGESKKNRKYSDAAGERGGAHRRVGRDRKQYCDPHPDHHRHDTAPPKWRADHQPASAAKNQHEGNRFGPTGADEMG